MERWFAFATWIILGVATGFTKVWITASISKESKNFIWLIIVQSTKKKQKWKYTATYEWKCCIIKIWCCTIVSLSLVAQYCIVNIRTTFIHVWNIRYTILKIKNKNHEQQIFTIEYRRTMKQVCKKTSLWW